MSFIQTVETDVEKIEAEVKAWISKVAPRFQGVLSEAVQIAPEVEKAIDILIGVLGSNPELTAVVNLIQKFISHISSGGVLDSSTQLVTDAETAAIKAAEAALPNASPEALTTAIGLAAGAATKEIADAQVAATSTKTNP